MMNDFPHIRFWQGFAHPALFGGEFKTALQKVLIPMTTEVGARRGLIGYTPVVTEQAGKPEFLPDEFALVIYRDQALYDGIRATPEGARYGALHFKMDGVRNIPGMESLEGRELFVRKDSYGGASGSAVAIPVEDKPEFDMMSVRFGESYAPLWAKNPLWGESSAWQGGATLVRVHLRRPGTTDNHYLDSLAHYLKFSASTRQIAGHVVRVEKDYVIEYLFGIDEGQIKYALEELDGTLLDAEVMDVFQRTWLKPLTDAESHARGFPITDAPGGSGYQLRFDTLPAPIPD